MFRIHVGSTLCLIAMSSLAAGCSQAPQAPQPTQASVPGTPKPSGDAAHREATWQYWQGLLKVSKKLDTLETDPRFKTFAEKKTEPRTTQEVIDRCQQGAKLCDQISEELRSSIRELEALPLLSVDSEALEIGSMTLEALREARSVMTDAASLAREGASLVEDGNSLGTFFEVVLTGNKRISERQQRFQKNWEKMAERFEDVSRKDKKINSEIRRARITLTQRYNRDFPSMD